MPGQKKASSGSEVTSGPTKFTTTGTEETSAPVLSRLCGYFSWKD